MVSRRQEKFNRAIKEAVSEVIQNRLNDPRIEGLVSVTSVDTSADLKNVDVYLSVFCPDQSKAGRTFTAIEHARKHIQHEMGDMLTGRQCPVLKLHRDTTVHKTIETLKLIEQVKEELDQRDSRQQEQSDIEREEDQ